jgi:predicted component of type VI protein secretion system
MLMTTIQRLAVAGALALALALAGCAKGKDEQLAYDVCLDAAKKDPKYAKATLATKEQSNIQASTGDAAIRVNIPYELEGKKGLYQCIADKQTDGTYKVTF